MAIHITMSIPTLSRYDLLVKAIETIAASTRRPDILMIIDNGGSLQEWMGTRQFAMPAKVLVPGSNLGVGPSCNLAWGVARQYYLHSNDDVEFDSKCIQLLAESAEANPDRHFFIPASGVGLAFTVFLATRQMFEMTGGFDEQFWPAFFEDNCLGRRMNIQGIARTAVEGASYMHHISATMKTYNQVEMQLHHQRFRANEERYQQKWGGSPEHETWDVPYNGARGHTKEHPELWAKPEVK